MSLHSPPGPPLPRRSPRRSRWQLIRVGVPAVTALALLSVLVDGRDGNATDSLAGPMLLALSLTGAITAGRAGVHPSLDRRTRTAWRTLALGHALLAAGCLCFAAFPGFPGPGDAVRLAVAPLFLVAALRFPVPQRSPRDRQRLALDTAIVVSCGFVVLWYVALGPALVAPDLRREVALVAVAYPLADLVLLLGAAKALLGGLGSSTRRPLVLLVIGLGCLVAADTVMADNRVQEAIDGVRPGQTAPVAMWVLLVVAFMFLTTASIDQMVLASGSRLRAATDRQSRSVNLVPYAAVAIAYGLLLVIATGAGLYPWGGLIVGAVTVTGLVVARQVIELRETHTHAVTDSMTGLANRPRYNDALTRALHDAERSGISLGVLAIDLDGFKTINDTLGHATGDDVLIAFADILHTTISRTDTAGRLGGDEFAVVLPDAATHTNVAAVATRLTSTLTTPIPLPTGEMTLHASIGIAVSHPGDTPDTLMHRADTHMYETKRAHRAHREAERRNADPATTAGTASGSGQAVAPELVDGGRA